MRLRILLSLVLLLLAACGRTEGTLQSGDPLPAPTIAATPRPHSPGVADLLRQRPSPGERVEVDAYYSGSAGMSVPRSGQPPTPGQVACPDQLTILTDQPYQATVQMLNAVQSSPPPADSSWLIATHPVGVVNRSLPYHARLRGYVGEAAFSGCKDAERIFVVEEVVATYPEQPPTAPFTMPADYATWSRYSDETNGFSLALPPGWLAEPLDATAVRLRSSQRPDESVLVRVHAGAVPDQMTMTQGSYGSGFFTQGWTFGKPWDDSQKLAGMQLWRNVEDGRREIQLLLGGEGSYYELSVSYGNGFALPQQLLTTYSVMVESFRLANPPTTPFPTPGPLPTAAPEVAATPNLVVTDVSKLPTEMLPATATPVPYGEPLPTQYPTPSPAALPGDFTLTLVAEAHVGDSRTITFTATLAGGSDNSYELYCPSESWGFGDGGVAMFQLTCQPWTPDARIMRSFSTSYTYKGPGTYTVELQLGPLTANPITVEVR